MAKPRKPSRFGAIHDRYLDSSPKKTGAKYERLAALVMKVLDNAGVVVHDLRLRGESTVKHQIDVVFDTSGEEKRILIECKDFDVSGDLVGLGIVRNFVSVARDLEPDRAIILTCNGFEKDAETFAKYNGIEMAVLREFREADWDGLIKTVHLTLLVASTDVRSVSINPRGAEDQRDPILVDRETPAYITVEGEEAHILEFVNRIKDEHHAPGDGTYDLEITSDDLSLRIPGHAPIPLRSINVVLEHRTTSSEMVITSSKLEELLLHWHDGTKQVIYSEDLEKLSIDREKRTVVSRADKPPSGGT